MTDSFIRDTTPAGSVLLAYGESPKGRSPRLFAVLGAVVLLGGLLGALLWTMLSAEIPLPKSTILVAYIRSNNEPLPAGAPALWRKAQQETVVSPLLLGLARDAQGIVQPFTVAIPGGNLNTEHDLGDAPPVPLSSLVNRWSELASRSWLRMWGEGGASLGGVLTAHQWSTELAVPGGQAPVEQIRGQNYIHMGSIPTIWPFMETLLRNQGIPIDLDTDPTAISWSFDSGKGISTLLQFSETLSPTTKSQIAGAGGIVDKFGYTLPDGTVVTELRLPATSAEGQLFQENTAILGDSTLFSEPREIPERCAGAIVAIFDQRSVQSFFSSMGLDRGNLGSLFLLNREGKLHFCW